MNQKTIETAGKTETFWTRNVKLITFLCCVAVFLAVFGPISVFRIIDYVEEHRIIENGMTFSDVVALSAYGQELTISQLTVFDCESAVFDDGIHISANVDGGKYLLYGVADKTTCKMTYLTLTYLSEERTADVLKDDLASFFQK